MMMGLQLIQTTLFKGPNSLNFSTSVHDLFVPSPDVHGVAQLRRNEQDGIRITMTASMMVLR